MKFVLGAAQSSVIATVNPLSQEDLVDVLAREIDFELRYAKDRILNATDNREKKFSVFVPEFQPTSYAFQQGNSFETTRKLLARKLAEKLQQFSKKSEHYQVVTFDEVRTKLELQDNQRATLQHFSCMDDSPFIWIDGAIQPFDREKVDPSLSKALENVKVFKDYDQSMLHITCKIHRGDHAIPLTQWNGLMNYVIQNPDDRVESFPRSIPPQITRGRDPGDPSMFQAITLDRINLNVPPPPPDQPILPPQPIVLTNPLDNLLLKPEIWVKKPNAPKMPDNPTHQMFSAYVFSNYENREVVLTENNELQVDLKIGEEFIVILDVHKRDESVRWTPPQEDEKNKPYLFARVLIDGRNTVAQAIPKDDELTVDDDYKTVFRSAEYVSVRNAEPWYIPSDDTLVVIPGFTSLQDQFPRAFTMTDKVVRDRQGNTISDFTGLIQIIAYLPEKYTPHRGPVMPGEPFRYKPALIDTCFMPGDMIGIWVIQYGK